MTDERRAKRDAAKQREKERREAERRKANRAELLRRLRFSLILGLGVVVLLVATNLTSGDVELPGSYLRLRELPTACDAEPPPPEVAMTFDQIPPQNLIAGTTVTIVTSCGDLVVRLDPVGAPSSVDAFAFLAREGYYAGTAVIEVTEGLRLIAGDQDPGRPDEAFRSGIPNEFPPDGFSLERGTVALAGDSSNRSGAFMIVLADDTPLSSRINVIGELVDGEEVLDRIVAIDRVAQPGTGSRTLPGQTVYIEEITIEG